jgi:hypothetical protein
MGVLAPGDAQNVPIPSEKGVTRSVPTDEWSGRWKGIRQGRYRLEVDMTMAFDPVANRVTGGADVVIAETGHRFRLEIQEGSRLEGGYLHLVTRHFGAGPSDQFVFTFPMKKRRDGSIEGRCQESSCDPPVWLTLTKQKQVN